MSTSGGSVGLYGSVRLLLKYVAPNKRAFSIVVLLSLLDAGLSAQISLSFKYLIDGAITQKSGQMLALITAALAVSITVVGTAGIFRDRLYGRTAAGLSCGMRAKIFQHLQRLSANFYLRMQAADIVSRFSNDLTEVESAFVSAVPYAILPALEIIFSIVLIFMLDWRLAIPALAAFPVAMAGPRWLSSKTSSAAYEQKTHEAMVVASVQENVSAQALVRAFNLETLALSYFNTYNKSLEKIGARLGYLTLLMERSASFSTQLLHVAVLGLGGYLTFRGEMTIGTLAAFQALFGTLAESLGYIAEYLPEIVRASGGMIRIEQLLAEKPMVADSDATVQLTGFDQAIELRDVTFGYEPGQKTLEHLSLTIARGTTVAIVGSSGSGKSTVLTLLMRFYDPVEGALSIDAHDLREITQGSLRARISIVFQENVLFNSSIRENIRMARPDAADDQVIEAAEKAGLHDFIENLAEGYDTVVLPNDGRFPAGQRQRVAIARALLREPEILLLDDATSALDMGSEAEINDTIHRAAKGRTVIAATHRLASVTGADRIFVLEKGTVAEEGTHAGLLEKDGVYAKMWKKQSGFTISADGAQVHATPDWLCRVPILSQLDETILAKLSEMFVTESYSKGDFIIHEGAVGEKFFILVRGMVEVLKSTSGGFQRMAVLQDGDHFGETALILNSRRNASIRGLAECTLLSLDRDRFLALLEQAPELRWKLREEASITAFRSEAEASGETGGTSGKQRNRSSLRHDLLNSITQIAGYSEMAAEDLDESGETERADLARKVREEAAEVQAGIERALPPRASVTGALLAILDRQTSAPLARLKEVAEVLKAATAGDEFASLHADLEKTVAECDHVRAMITGASADTPSPADVAQPEREESPARRAAGTGHPAGKVWRLLVVDDNDSGRNLLCRKLERLGYAADDAASGKAALEKINQGTVDLVLLDVMMPDMDGYEVLDRLRKLGRLDRLPVIMTTAMDDMPSLIRCLEMGADDYLTKPYDPLLLRARLTSALERKRIRDEDQRSIARMSATIAELEEKWRMRETDSSTRRDAEEPR